MIPYLQAQIARLTTPAEKRSIVREYLQVRILQSLQRVGAMIPLAFHGGTALRLLYQLPRYSEDLDFALERHPEQYTFRHYLEAIQRDLTAEAYTIEIKLSENRAVHSAFVRFPGLLYRLNLTPHESELIAIKLEIDTNPPAQASLATTIIHQHVDVHLQHHDPASLLAGKLHAILQRDYVKGRDWYDLYWYLRQGDWPAPNTNMLNEALHQSGWEKGLVTSDNWQSYIQARLQTLSWPRVVEDVQRFVITQSDLAAFNKETLGDLLNQHDK